MNRQLYNMGGPSQPRQMYDMGGSSLQAGAPDLRLTGDVRPTYTQGRKNRMDMAFGGIAGLDGRKRYGIGSWFQEKIMDPIKDNPVTSAVIGGGLINQFGLPGGSDYGKNFLGELLGKVTGTPVDTVLGGRVDGQFNLGDYLKGVVSPGSTSNEIDGLIGDQTGYEGGPVGIEGVNLNYPNIQDYLPEPLKNILNSNSGVNTANMTEAQRGQLELAKYKRGNLLFYTQYSVRQ